MSKIKLLTLSLLFLALAIFFANSAETQGTWLEGAAFLFSFLFFIWFTALNKRDARILEAAKKKRQSTTTPQSETPASDSRRLFVPPAQEK